MKILVSLETKKSLELAEKIKDYVDGFKISGTDLWKHGGLAMYNRAEHWGEYIGTGKRNVLCIFTE